MTDRLPNGLTDKYDHGQMQVNLHMDGAFKKFHASIFVGFPTVMLADGRTDRTGDGHTERWMEFNVESFLGYQTDELCD